MHQYAPGNFVMEVEVVGGDIRSFNADVIALKHARIFYGADAAIAECLLAVGISLENIHPEVGEHTILESRGAIAARSVLFVGVPSLSAFGYPQIREFSAKVLEILATVAPNIQHLAMTIHGAGYGLDEVEAARQQLAGYHDALAAGLYPRTLRRLSIVERDQDRVELLVRTFSAHLSTSQTPPGWSGRKNCWPILLPHAQVDADRPMSAQARAWRQHEEEKELAEKPRVFVAMPFAKDMRVVWKYGIQQPVHNAGLLCERVDQEVFLGDVLVQVKKRIESAALVIADLTGANPNVFLEIGYAWGKDRPTLLLFHGTDKKLPFDVRGQKCILYEDAVDLEEKLASELEGLKSSWLRRKSVGQRE